MARRRSLCDPRRRVHGMDIFVIGGYSAVEESIFPSRYGRSVSNIQCGDKSSNADDSGCVADMNTARFNTERTAAMQ